MKQEIKDKIILTNQRYLKPMLEQDIPAKLENQLETMDWSYIDLIHDKEQKEESSLHLEQWNFLR